MLPDDGVMARQVLNEYEFVFQKLSEYDICMSVGGDGLSVERMFF